jgi:hypothetical protein
MNEPKPSEGDICVEWFKRCKLRNSDDIPAEQIRAGGKMSYSEIRKLN